MPYPEYGALLPTEALFTEPSAYSGVLKAEAQKRASYLSSMDQFYAELEEATRRFEKQYTLAEKEFVFGVEESEWEREFKEKTLASQERLAGRELDIKEEAVDVQRFGIRTQADIEREAQRRAMTEEEEFEAASSFLEELYGAQKAPSYKEPYQDFFKLSTPTTPEVPITPEVPMTSPGFEILTPGVPGIDWIETMTEEGYRKFTVPT